MERDGIDLNILHRWDNHALKMLYSQFYKALTGYAQQLVDNETVADDMVQDVMLSTWQHRHTYSTEGQLKAYLYNAVRNECINHLRHMQVKQSHVEHIEQRYREMQTDANGELLTHKEELYRQMFMAIDQLPMKQREVFLQVMEGRKNSEIAEALQVSINTVKKLRQRGMDRLRSKLSPEALTLLLVLTS